MTITDLQRIELPAEADRAGDDVSRPTSPVVAWCSRVMGEGLRKDNYAYGGR